MKQRTRKIAAILFGLMLVASSGHMVHAEETTATNVLTLNKDIVVSNPEGSAVYGPAVTYTYDITPAAAGGTVNDGSNSVVVKAGIAGAVDASQKSITFTNAATVASSAAGTDLSGSAQFVFDASKFPSAGIYRYNIKENLPANYAAAGLTRAETYEDDRYLDVYVKNGENGLEIYAFILFEGSASDNVNTSTAKSDGYTSKTDEHTTTPDLTDVDMYKTTNLTVSKTITGTLADMTHEFPFAVNVDSAVVTEGKMIVKEGTTEEAVAFDGSYKIGALDANSALKLGNGDSIIITGIPVGDGDDSTYTANEFNDTPDTYAASGAASKTLQANTATENEAAALSADAATTAAFTNTLDAISQTGVVLRFAPYALMLGAGIILLMLGKRRRVVDEA